MIVIICILLLIAIMMYLVIVGSNIDETDEDIEREMKEQIKSLNEEESKKRKIIYHKFQ